ncbi:cyclic nucleotide-gated cation channel beta-3 [Eurytemora carolleeae]|uniref:cyclic nucleotide-gated cation channel beta-3 n=1 Tax=Eurytemora carolleeae TaxID=1294199 RepID=UPI000C783F7A|nr:cyclic nucleotide-gated cation channel beta-3 [Eurytemora carolleeae]|eukprot:XP_023323760.1 cyclic nucleotide-gated cation channel beta-3-like [Eurytemora affinis]
MITVWYCILMMALLYNAWTIPLRTSFTLYQTPENTIYWMIGDYISDFFYWSDILLIKPRMMYLNEHGIYESQRRNMFINYIKKGDFKTDLASSLPFDVFYIFTGVRGTTSLLRLNRILKNYTFTRAFDRLDAASPHPTVVRLVRTVNIMLYLIHLNACAFYAFSAWEGLGSNKFVYSGVGSAYIRCFYFAVKTAMSIGKNPKPLVDNPYEILFMAVSWLMGIFVFAVLIGNVKDIIAQSTRNQDEYMKIFDAISQYMFRMHLPEETMNRVKTWCQFTWNSQKSFDERAILQYLPGKMMTDVALNIHFKTISGVKLFHGCNPGLLKMIVCRLKPIIFLPGDYICRKGDVGMEMFIVSSGAVQVVGGPNDSIVFVTLGPGVCFGEIALLGSGGMNRRTASIRAHGFTTLFVLFKWDLQSAMKDYPEDQNLLARKAAQAKKEADAKQAASKPKISQSEEIVFPTRREPQLIKTVIQLLPESHPLADKNRGNQDATDDTKNKEEGREIIQVETITTSLNF